MAYSRIIFERGLEVSSARNSLKIPSDQSAMPSLLNFVRTLYNVRPVVLTEVVPKLGGGEQDRNLVVTVDGQDLLDLRVGKLQLPQGIQESTYISLLQHAMNAQYVAGAMVYHCQKLALVYADICDQLIGIRSVMPIDGEYSSFQGRSEGYYEFEALVTAARRTYDSLRYILWPVFGSGGGQMPSNFPKTIKSCTRLPNSLRDRLSASWASKGEKLTSYRHCIHHYVPVTFGIETASMRKVDCGSWSVQLRIPDNPEAKSTRQFDFAGGLDALTYGWEVTDHVLAIAMDVFGSISVTA